MEELNIHFCIALGHLSAPEKHCQVCLMSTLVPESSLKSIKRVWCSELHFLSHEVGPYGVKNVTIVFKSGF